MEQKYEEIKLSKDDSFILKIIYCTDSISEYDNVQVRKIKNGKLCKEYLSGLDAAVLKCAYDYSKGSKKGYFITHKTKNAEATWPFYGDVRPRNYNKVIAFLENYACYFVYEQREGVYWDPTPTITEVPSVTKIETKTIHQCKVSPKKTKPHNKRQDNKHTQDEQPYSKKVERHDLSENDWLEIVFYSSIDNVGREMIDWHRVSIISYFNNTQSVIPLTIPPIYVLPLTGKAAAILKYLIDHETEIIRTTDWPSDIFPHAPCARDFREAKNYLGKYHELIEFRRGIGVIYSRTFLFNKYD